MGHDSCLLSAPSSARVPEFHSHCSLLSCLGLCPLHRSSMAGDQRAQGRRPGLNTGEVQNENEKWAGLESLHTSQTIWTSRDTSTNKSSQPVIWWQSDFFPNVTYSFIIFHKTDLDYNLVPLLLLKRTPGLDGLSEILPTWVHWGVPMLRGQDWSPKWRLSEGGQCPALCQGSRMPRMTINWWCWWKWAPRGHKKEQQEKFVWKSRILWSICHLHSGKVTLKIQVEYNLKSFRNCLYWGKTF